MEAKHNINAAMTVGLDLGDRFSQYCLVNALGEVVEEGRIQSSLEAMRRHFEGELRLRVALECGTHSPWVSRLLSELGHQVVVANARKIAMITASTSKNDRNDAEQLARLAAYDPQAAIAAASSQPAAAAGSEPDSGTGYAGAGADDAD